MAENEDPEAFVEMAKNLSGTELDASAGAMRDLFDNFVKAEFSEGQAIFLIAVITNENPIYPPSH